MASGVTSRLIFGLMTSDTRLGRGWFSTDAEGEITAWSVKLQIQPDTLSL